MSRTREGVRRHREVEQIERIILAIRDRPALAHLDDAEIGKAAAVIYFGMLPNTTVSDLADFAAGIEQRLATRHGGAGTPPNVTTTTPNLERTRHGQNA